MFQWIYHVYHYNFHKVQYGWSFYSWRSKKIILTKIIQEKIFFNLKLFYRTYYINTIFQILQIFGLAKMHFKFKYWRVKWAENTTDADIKKLKKKNKKEKKTKKNNNKIIIIIIMYIYT